MLLREWFFLTAECTGFGHLTSHMDNVKLRGFKIGHTFIIVERHTPEIGSVPIFPYERTTPCAR